MKPLGMGGTCHKEGKCSTGPRDQFCKWGRTSKCIAKGTSLQEWGHSLSSPLWKKDPGSLTRKQKGGGVGWSGGLCCRPGFWNSSLLLANRETAHFISCKVPVGKRSYFRPTNFLCWHMQMWRLMKAGFVFWAPESEHSRRDPGGELSFLCLPEQRGSHGADNSVKFYCQNSKEGEINWRSRELVFCQLWSSWQLFCITCFSALTNGGIWPKTNILLGGKDEINYTQTTFYI